MPPLSSPTTSSMLPDLERVERISEFSSHPQSRAVAELLIDCKEDGTLRGGAGLELREGDRRPLRHQRREPMASATTDAPIQAAAYPNATVGENSVHSTPAMLLAARFPKL